MDDAGAEAVSTGLAGLTRLSVLSLYKNYIGDEGGLAVAREVALLPALRTLWLQDSDESSLDQTTRVTIRNMLPHITDVTVNGWIRPSRSLEV